MYWFSDLIQVYPAACIKRRTHVREVFERSGIETGFCSLQAAPYAPFPFGRYTRIMDLRIISDWKMITKFRGEAFTWGLGAYFGIPVKIPMIAVLSDLLT